MGILPCWESGTTRCTLQVFDHLCLLPTPNLSNLLGEPFSDRLAVAGTPDRSAASTSQSFRAIPARLASVSKRHSISIRVRRKRQRLLSSPLPLIRLFQVTTSL
jgi:hypothetical protein